MAMKYCPCEKEKKKEEYIKCPFYGLKECPCHLNDCIVYRIYENSESMRTTLMEISERLGKKFSV